MNKIIYTDMIKRFEQYDENPIKKVWYVTTHDLGKLANKWIEDNPHNNGYALEWIVTEPEKSAYPEIEEYFLSHGLKLFEKVIVHSFW